MTLDPSLIQHAEVERRRSQIHKFLSSEPTNWNPELTMTDYLLYFQLFLTFNQKCFPFG